MVAGEILAGGSAAELARHAAVPSAANAANSPKLALLVIVLIPF
jgi:hypothetical protein